MISFKSSVGNGSITDQYIIQSSSNDNQSIMCNISLLSNEMIDLGSNQTTTSSSRSHLIFYWYTLGAILLGLLVNLHCGLRLLLRYREFLFYPYLVAIILSNIIFLSFLAMNIFINSSTNGFVHGLPVCALVIYVMAVTQHMPTLCLAAIAVERWTRLFHRRFLFEYSSSQSIMKQALTTAFLALICSLVHSWVFTSTRIAYSTCILYPDGAADADRVQAFMLVSTIIVYFIPFTLSTFFNSVVFIHIHLHVGVGAPERAKSKLFTNCETSKCDTNGSVTSKISKILNGERATNGSCFQCDTITSIDNNFPSKNLRKPTPEAAFPKLCSSSLGSTEMRPCRKSSEKLMNLSREPSSRHSPAPKLSLKSSEISVDENNESLVSQAEKRHSSLLKRVGYNSGSGYRAVSCQRWNAMVRRKKRTLVMFAALTLIDMLLNFPNHFLNIVRRYQPELLNPETMAVCEFAGYILWNMQFIVSALCVELPLFKRNVPVGPLRSKTLSETKKILLKSALTFTPPQIARRAINPEMSVLNGSMVDI